MLERSVQLNPGVAGAHHDLGLAMLAAGRPLEKAAEPFVAALRLNPRVATAHHYLAFIFDSLGQERKAMPHYKAAVALKPDLVEAQLRLGELYLARGRRAESMTAFRAGAAATRGTPRAAFAEARALEASGALDEALAAMRAIVEAHPANAEAACGLEWKDACLAPHRNARKIDTASVWQARQPIYRTSVGRWRRYEPWLGALRELSPAAEASAS